MQQLFPREGETQPRLRFPEFQRAGEWEVKKLGDFADVAASGDLDSDLFSPIKTESYCYPVYSNAVEKEGLYGFYSAPKYPANCVTITARGTLGVAFLRQTKFMGIGRLLVLNFNQGIDSRFMKDCWNHLAKIPQEVTSIPQLTAVTARVTIFPIPILEEQQAIANCLSSLDEIIAAQARKLETLKVHKKGLMQGLFPSVEEAGV
jgi:type I restriction enzyme S subunit